MICYRDRSYCCRRECTNNLCTDRLTEEIIEAAERVGLPLSLIDCGDQPCYTMEERTKRLSDE